MPRFNVTTKTGNSVWKSPDGQREIFEVTLDYNGQEVKAKTYSKDIPVVGWSGEIETYEKEGRNGSETFVKQPPKEDGYPSPAGSRQSSIGGGSSYTPRDDSHIKAQWAIGQSVIVHNETTDLSSADLESVESLAVELFKMVDRVKASPADEAVQGPSDAPAVPDEIHEVTGDEMPEDFLKNIDEIFPGTEPAAKPKETPWPKS